MADDFHADSMLDDLAAGGNRYSRNGVVAQFGLIRHEIGRRSADDRTRVEPRPGLGVGFDRWGLLNGGLILLTAPAVPAAMGQAGNGLRESGCCDQRNAQDKPRGLRDGSP